MQLTNANSGPILTRIKAKLIVTVDPRSSFTSHPNAMYVLRSACASQSKCPLCLIVAAITPRSNSKYTVKLKRTYPSHCRSSKPCSPRLCRSAWWRRKISFLPDKRRRDALLFRRRLALEFTLAALFCSLAHVASLALHANRGLAAIEAGCRRTRSFAWCHRGRWA